MPQLIPASCRKVLWKVFLDSKLIVRTPKSHNEEKISRTIETPEIDDLISNNAFHSITNIPQFNFQIWVIVSSLQAVPGFLS